METVAVVGEEIDLDVRPTTLARRRIERAPDAEAGLPPYTIRGRHAY